MMSVHIALGSSSDGLQEFIRGRMNCGDGLMEFFKDVTGDHYVDF
jgi:hypothetical protein